MASRVLRVGIIGVGAAAVRSHVPQLRKTGRAEVVAVARRNQEALAEARAALGVEAAYGDWRTLLEHPDLDAVVVATAPQAHTAPALAALERGLHVLVEKPLALRSDEAWALVDAAEASDRVVMVCYQNRCRADMRSAQRALASGAIGQVRQIVMHWAIDFRWLWDPRSPVLEMFRAAGVPSFQADWRRDSYWRKNPEESGGGQFADAGSHFVDLALWFAGAPATQVSGFTENVGLPVDAVVAAQARLRNGVLLSLASADVVPGKGGVHLTVLGDTGSLTSTWGATTGGPTRDIWLETPAGREPLVVDAADAGLVAAFVASALDGSPNPIPPRDAAHVTAFTEAVYRSAATGQVVAVREHQ